MAFGRIHKGSNVTVLEQIGLTGSIPDTSLMVTDVAAIGSYIAALVADGATPTKDHVDTLNAGWAVLVADWNTLSTAIGGSQVGTPLSTDKINAIIQNPDGSHSKVKVSELTS